jgi:hypothetical protein
MLAEVARVLSLMSTQPNARARPEAGDLEGTFDTWFDGGAVNHDTGISRYVFADGSVAITGSAVPTTVHITLANGTAVDVTFDATASADVSGGATGTSTEMGGRAFLKVYAVHRRTGEQYLLVYEDIEHRKTPVQFIRFRPVPDSGVLSSAAP